MRTAIGKQSRETVKACSGEYFAFIERFQHCFTLQLVSSCQLFDCFFSSHVPRLKHWLLLESINCQTFYICLKTLNSVVIRGAKIMRNLNMEKDSMQLLFEIKSQNIFYNLTVSFTFCKRREAKFWYL